MKFVDLFCGAGGLTEGLRQAGWEHYAGVELDPRACETYAANHGAVMRKDVRTLHLQESVSLVAASPPCQTVSGANRCSGEAHANDTLFEEVVRIARETRAQAVLIENVPRFATKLSEISGDAKLSNKTRISTRSAAVEVSSKRKTLADRAVELLELEGFDASWRVLDASEFGVPQKRRRLFVVGVRRNSRPFQWPEATGKGLNFGSVRVSHAEAMKSGAKEPPPHRSYDVFMSPEKMDYYERRHKERPQYVRFLEDGMVPNTLRAGYLKSRGAEALVRGTDEEGRPTMRMLTVEECARIQGFPAHYQFKGPAGAVYKQIGNAVPPPLARAVGAAILTCLS